MKDFQELQSLIKTSLSNLKPFSGQTLILLSLFSWVMSLLISTDLMKDLLARLGWIFLTLGLGWVMADFKFKVFGATIYPGPWVTGALTCGFIFQGWTPNISTVLVAWPLVSAFIAIVPKLLKHKLDLVNPNFSDAQKLASDRQDMVKLFLICSIFSCWFQFHFLLQGWLQDYPSLMTDSFNRSAFVIKVDMETPDTSRGSLILSLVESSLNERLNRLSWAEVERWLLNVRTEIVAIKSEVMAKIPDSPEDSLWDLQAQVLPGNPDYTLRLLAVWQGPSSQPGGYYAQKSCEIAQVINPTSPTVSTPSDTGNTAPATTSRIACEPTVDRIPFQNPMQS